MTTVLVTAAVLGSLAVMVVRSIVMDEIKGCIRRALVARLEHIIQILPPHLQDEWGEEWRAELVALLAMPISAVLWLRGVGQGAREFASSARAEPGATPSAATVGPLHHILIEELELGVRSYNCLKRAGIQTVGDLISRTERELSTIPNFGMKSLDEVIETLHNRGLDLRTE